MDKKTQRFISTFEKIVVEVNRLAGVPLSSSFELKRAAKLSSTVRKYHRRLASVRSARNLLQHPTQSLLVWLVSIFSTNFRLNCCASAI